ncbi:hypothetical protein DH2020_033816 [Rehmannia glutinosa]|uniref:Uncharacterized protein n=1 Tax=Rehmannia glutinosa TaxID=99300 RepID=A0ABR0VE12_REHGL
MQPPGSDRWGLSDVSGRKMQIVMVEAKAVVDGKKDRKKSKQEKRGKWKWAALGAVLVLVAAIAITSKNQKSCQCSQDSRKYTGIVEDCCCDYETVDSLNGQYCTLCFRILLELRFSDTLRMMHGLMDIVSFAGEMTYVNLQLNPERYTGYTGPSARRIWDAIYSENCPKYTSGEICQEKRVLYKLISGLHSSISIHIAADYLLDEAKNMWGRNPELMYDRVLRYPDRVRNLYFTFMFVLRAVTKAANYLEQAEYDTGSVEEDLKAQSLMRQMLYNPKLQAACPLPFDEAKLWQGKGGPELKLEIQKQFKNISALMDCVGCEKCRLWGKLQVLGLGTALKILFSVDGKNYPNESLQLQRNEVIALVNLLHRLSESVKLVHEIGPSIEQSMEFTSELPMQEISLLQRAWEAVGRLQYVTVVRFLYFILSCLRACSRPLMKILDTIDEEKAYGATLLSSSNKMIDRERYHRQVSPFE